jgi:CMP-N,N'-diacetyllegionaminic acid synthase
MSRATSRVLGIIPARGGSKGIPDKNLKLLAGRPLLAYAVDAARESRVIDRLILSTDSQRIADVGRGMGVDVPFLRPAELALDDTPMQPVLEHAVAELERGGSTADIIVLLQPTAPLRQPRHLVAAVELMRETGCDSVVSVVEVPAHYAPHFAMKIVSGRLDYFLPDGKRVTRRQDVEPAYSRDGTVYAFRRDLLMEQHTIYGPDCRPMILPASESVNLDSVEDWETAERMLSMERRPA